MKLQFCCESHSPVGEAAHRELVDQIGQRARLERGAARGAMKDGQSPSLAIQFEVCCEQDDATATIDRVLDVVAEVSSRFHLSWSIGHQHEPHLGCLREGTFEPGLKEGIATSLHVARALRGMFEDDEFVDVDHDASDESDHRVMPSGDETAWNQLLDRSESFTPFPELDDN